MAYHSRPFTVSGSAVRGEFHNYGFEVSLRWVRISSLIRENHRIRQRISLYKESREWVIGVSEKCLLVLIPTLRPPPISFTITNLCRPTTLVIDLDRFAAVMSIYTCCFDLKLNC